MTTAYLNPARSRLAAACAVVLCTAISGCASITTGTTHLIYVEARHKDAEIRGATCTLENSAGKIELKTPGSGTVKRASSDLTIACERDGLPNGTVVARSRLKGALFGNIIFGGGIGAIIDASSGAAYDYAQKVVVQMGESLTVEPEAYVEAHEREAAERQSGGLR